MIRFLSSCFFLAYNFHGAEKVIFISECVTQAAKELGNPVVKLDQVDVARAFVEGRYACI